MANAVYPLYKNALLTGAANADLDNDTTDDGPYCALVDTDTYTYAASDEFYSDLSGIVGTPVRIETPTVGSVSAATFDGDDITFSSVSGATVEALVIYRHNAGANTTWRLVFYEDTGVTGLPLTPNGGDVTVTWNASGILMISDRRMKTDIEEIGDLGALPLYSFRYRGGGARRVGVMAQDVEKVYPAAVVDLGAFKAVSHPLLVKHLMAA